MIHVKKENVKSMLWYTSTRSASTLRLCKGYASLQVTFAVLSYTHYLYSYVVHIRSK